MRFLRTSAKTAAATAAAVVLMSATGVSAASAATSSAPLIEYCETVPHAGTKEWVRVCEYTPENDTNGHIRGAGLMQANGPGIHVQIDRVNFARNDVVVGTAGPVNGPSGTVNVQTAGYTQLGCDTTYSIHLYYSIRWSNGHLLSGQKLPLKSKSICWT